MVVQALFGTVEPGIGRHGAAESGAIMRKLGIILAGLAGVVAFASSANAASFSACQSITDPTQRLACYDQAAKAPAASGKTTVASRAPSAAFNAAPATLPVKAVAPVVSGPRYWVEAEGGIYGFSKNLTTIASITPPVSTGPTFVPTSPGFIGLMSVSTAVNPLVTGTSPDLGGGGSYRMGYWLDPARTMAIDGSVFYVRGQSNFTPFGTPTVVRTTNFINTTPAVFVSLFTDTTTTTLANGSTRDQLYGGDINFRTKFPQFAAFSNFEVLFGLRYAALDEKLSANINSTLFRGFAAPLGIPFPTDFGQSITGLDSFRLRNDFIGPQVGFSAEQHWGPYWVASENKLAVGAMMEHVSVTGVNVFGNSQTMPFILAGIPLTIAAPGTPSSGVSVNPAFGLFGQPNRSNVTFAAVPSGNIKFGYDINSMLSVTLAYNYLYMSNVGRVGDQVAFPTGIAQSGFFAQGITVGAKAKF
jgi:hypothetical protein